MSKEKIDCIKRKLTHLMQEENSSSPEQILLLHDALPSEVPDSQTCTVQGDGPGTFKVSPDCGLCILCQLEELREGPPIEEELLHWGVALHTCRHHLCCACPQWRILALQKTQ